MINVAGHKVQRKSVALLCLLALSFTVCSLPVTVYASGPFSNWGYMKTLTIDHNMVTGSLTDFPVLISLVDPDLAVHAQSSGNDILFALSDGTQLAHEIDNYNPVTGTLVAWVNVPVVSDTADTTIYMYYGNPTAGNQQNPVAVWDPNYKAVYHMNDGTSTSDINDSTTNSHNGLKTNAGNPTQTTGQIAQSQQNTATNKIEFADSSDWYFTGDFTIEVWVNFNHINSQYWQNAFVAQDISLGVANKWMFCYDPVQGTKLEYFIPSVDSHSQETHGNAWTAATGTWYDLVVTKSGNTISYYRNGAPDGTYTDAVPLPDVSNTMTLFWSEQPTGYLNGKLDEVRISNGIARSSAWIATEYANQNSPSTFYTVGSEIANPNMFVMPESPLGSLAVIVAVAGAFMLFTKRKSLFGQKTAA